jgi:hypothetical protein
MIAEKYENMGQLANARSYAMKSFRKHFSTSVKSTRMLLRLYVPKLYKLLRSVKRTAYLIMGKK